jgi:hypothetical protein
MKQKLFQMCLPLLLVALVFAGCKKEDTTAPTITLVGANPMNVDMGDSFTDPGATATDEEDGDLTSSIVATGTVDVNTAGAYTRTYVVSDAAGNSATATRAVNVNLSRDFILGNYHTTTTCNTFPYNTVSTIPQFLAGSTDSKFIIRPFYYNSGSNGDVSCTISGNTVTVDAGQAPGPIGDGVTGSGTFNSAGTILVMDYTFTPNGGSPTSCSVTYTHD